MTSPDFADDQTHIAHASAIYAQTVPLASKSLRLSNISTTTLAANTPVVLGPFTVGQIGYEISLDIGVNAGSTSPIMQALMTWTDSVTGRIVEEQRWGLAGASGANPQTYYGSGPSSADTLTVTLTNTDTVNSMTYALVLAANSRVYVRHDWRQRTSFPVPGFTNGNFDQAGQFLIQEAPTVGAGGNAVRLVPLYCGMVRIWCTFNQQFDITIAAIDRSISVAPAGNQVWQQTVVAAAGGIVVAELALPRCTSTVQLTNNGAAQSQFGFTMIIAERQP